MTGQQAVTIDPLDALTLDELRQTWDGIYDVGHADGTYFAFRLTGGPLLPADTIAGLDSTIRADWNRWSKQ